MWRWGGLYFAIVFAFAFGFGTVRTLALEPALGKDWAVAIEAPFLVAVMAFAARWMRRAGLGLWELLGAGVFALVLQQCAEVALVLARGQSLSDYARSFATPAG